MIFPPSQKSLHECALRLADGTLEKAGLFPFFKTSGETRAFMLVTASSPRITLVDSRPGMFERSPPWRKRLDLRSTDLRDSAAEHAEDLADLWHFDPWWELGAERYAGHPAVPFLKQTNIPGYDASVTRMWFSRDLSRVEWIGFGEGEKFQLKKFRRHLLDEAVRARGQARSRPRPSATRKEWVLNPWWSTR